MDKIAERFIRYAKIDTQSNDKSTTCPSTNKQFNLAKILKDELEHMGINKTELDENGYLYAQIPANVVFKVPAIGFIAHLDTSPDMPSENVKPILIKGYSGKDILLNQEKGIVLSPNEFPELARYKGNDLIVTDGNTLLGADDKAGVAEIMQMAQFVTENPEFKHGPIKIAFTPDEEIGRGADLFNTKKFGADYAYTIDGGGIGELEYENFNAAHATIQIIGKNVHPGDAKNKMVNAVLILNRIIGAIPVEETPRYTEGYQGFYHVLNASGTVEEASAELLIRDHDIEKFQQKKVRLQEVIQKLNQEYQTQNITIEIKDQYFNMKKMIEPHFHMIETAKKAMELVGIEPVIKPIRGGTDGARLSYMGLPTPNIFSGGHNFHSRYEFVPVQSMEKATETLVKIIDLYAKASEPTE
ncbi:MAG TPA: peptidase T [Marinilabiliales bacterium]|jgi:tripeptide aminopeptidase|nr:MAG: peptidase T [Bacteroidetes bacterium GWA2_40_14]OFX61323.1 MAG: peptidase T [Bacteroidetes bacterium GWC2_40_13]OFX72519.1 MAG: peptidase T [Bacteroidetes bacterium GWD2_40_43]OFX90603.1 MAG: peptidase T [Bacteroidetes bacterium GWE2_40_63]OFY20919.1 MAG: peptidase T [Bacteroidetes bacterium GWF2_40_13]OFZ23661.1 MAG: peptidase T [Bacteroidetes bacterium RIFOXYC2_FULL_40_12]HAN00700.1 peptidase T [Marinilabiliales bacterium]